MTTRPFPTVAAWPLPAAALRTPLPLRTENRPAQEEPRADDNTTSDLARQVSDAIARRARQRRYTG